MAREIRAVHLWPRGKLIERPIDRAIHGRCLPMVLENLAAALDPDAISRRFGARFVSLRARARVLGQAVGDPRAGFEPGIGFRAGPGGPCSAALPAAASDWDAAEGPTPGPVAAAGSTEVARLGEAVIVVVAELGVGRGAAGAAGGRLSDAALPPGGAGGRRTAAD
ncbi:transducin family protein / WD-40 repeat family protein [Striga asiatica]|uniref:Transducin family protein / WD-40 repeat family protein n=1 Tax=Striga asiatica TaxID=4170 RepID=A0A5A7PY26_STRAF|nr:transducin family protein / WD-40 repeat family protein [Striga asiatica]